MNNTSINLYGRPQDCLQGCKPRDHSSGGSPDIVPLRADNHATVGLMEKLMASRLNFSVMR